MDPPLIMELGASFCHRSWSRVLFGLKVVFVEGFCSLKRRSSQRQKMAILTAHKCVLKLQQCTFLGRCRHYTDLLPSPSVLSSTLCSNDRRMLCGFFSSLHHIIGSLVAGKLQCCFTRSHGKLN